MTLLIKVEKWIKILNDVTLCIRFDSSEFSLVYFLKNVFFEK